MAGKYKNFNEEKRCECCGNYFIGDGYMFPDKTIWCMICISSEHYDDEERMDFNYEQSNIGWEDY